VDEAKSELLKRIVLGEVDLDAPEVVEAMNDPEFATEFDELADVVAALDESLVLEEARSRPVSAAEERIVARVRRELRPTRLRIVPAIVIAAAAALLLIVLNPLLTRSGNGVESSPTPHPTYLGEKNLECVSPVGPGADFSVFVVHCDLPDGRLEIEVLDGNGYLLGGGDSGTLEGVAWHPSAEAIATWPDRIEWIARWIGPDNRTTVIASATASR